MNKLIALLTLILLTLPFTGWAQNILVLDSISHDGELELFDDVIGTGGLYDIGQCIRPNPILAVSQFLSYFDVNGNLRGYNLFITDGTLGPDNKYYLITNEHPGYTPNTFLSANRGIISFAIDHPYGYESAASYGAETNPLGIATDYSGMGYVVGEGLSRYDFLGEQVTYLQNLAPEYQAGAQMAFYEGSFYYPNRNYELVQMKVRDDIAYHRIVGNLPDTIEYGGLLAIPYTCDSTELILVNNNNNSSSTLYLIDVDEFELQEHPCRYEVNGTNINGGNVISALYVDEAVYIPCDLQLDLQPQQDTTTHLYLQSCTNSVNLLEGDILLSPNQEYDSIVVEIQNPLDGTFEVLGIAGGGANINIAGENTQRLVLSSQGFAKTADYLEVLTGLSYDNTFPFTDGVRTIEVTAYHPFHGTISANIFLLLSVVNENMVSNAVLVSPLCNGDSNGSIVLTPSGGQSPYDFVWGNGVLVNEQSGLPAGSYEVAIIDTYSCELLDTIVLSEPALLTVDLSSSQDSICGASGVLSSLVTGAVSPYLYQWDTGNTEETINNLVPGFYELTVTGNNDCESTATYELFLVDTIYNDFREQSCLGNSIVFNNQSFTQDTTFQQLLTTPAGCDSLLDVQLIFLDTFYSYSAFELCPGESINLYDLVITQDTNFTVALQTVNGCDSLEYYEINLLDTPVTPLAASICAGESYPFAGQLFTESGVYYDTLQAATGCDSLAELTLIVHTLPAPAIVADGSLCNSGAATLATSLPYASFSWSDGTNGASIGINTPGSYAVTVTDDNGCSGAASLAVTDDPPSVDFTVSHPACPDGVGVLQINEVAGGSPPYLLVETGQEIVSGTNVNELAPASYTYTLQDANGCLVALDFSVMAENTIAVDLPPSLSIKLGESILLPVNASFVPAFINWSPPLGLDCADCLMPLASPTETTRYFLSLADDQGCSWEGSTLVEVAIPGIYIPNVFSPNNDGNNDQFGPIFNDVVQSIPTFSIFDRWGAQVFTANDQHNTWDGRINGAFAASGVYVYFIEWVDLAGNVRKETGEVLLLR